MHLNSSRAKDIFGIDMLFLEKKKKKENHSATLISPLLHSINLSIKEGNFPQSFKMAIITPIYKSVMSKVREKVIAIGFRKKCSSVSFQGGSEGEMPT